MLCALITNTNAVLMYLVDRHEQEVHVQHRHECPICNLLKYSLTRLRAHMQRCIGPKLPAPTPAQPQPSAAASDENAEQAPLALDESSVVVSSIISNARLDELIAPFMHYLQSSPISYLEHQFLKSRVQPNTNSFRSIRNNLRHILAIIYTSCNISQQQLSLRFLANVEVAKKVITSLENRSVGSNRLHQIALLVLKVLLYISSTARSKSGTYSPTMIASFAYVRGVLDASVKSKKQDEQSRLLQLTHSDTVMQRDELQLLATTTLQWLDAYADDEDRDMVTAEDAKKYQRYLLVAMLCNAPPQRSQIYSQLQIDRTLVRLQASNRYEIRMSYQQNSKTGQGLVLTLPAALTKAIDTYVSDIRPSLVAGIAVSSTTSDPLYLFTKIHSMERKTDYTDWTAQVCMEIIGRPIAPHKFRHSVVSIAAEAGASESELKALAESMAHTPSSAARYYQRVQHLQSSETSNRLIGSLFAAPSQPVQHSNAPQQQLPPVPEEPQVQQHAQQQLQQKQVQQPQPQQHQPQPQQQQQPAIPRTLPRRRRRSRQSRQPGPAAAAAAATSSSSRYPPLPLQNVTDEAVNEVDAAEADNLPLSVRYSGLFARQVTSASAQQQQPLAVASQPLHQAQRVLEAAFSASASSAASSTVGSKRSRTPAREVKQEQFDDDPFADEFVQQLSLASTPVDSSSSHKRYKASRTVTKWTLEQVEHLRRAVATHGAHWQTILADPEYAAVLGHRSAANIRSKWFNIQQRTQSRSAVPAMSAERAAPTPSSSAAEAMSPADAQQPQQQSQQQPPVDLTETSPDSIVDEHESFADL